MDATLLATLALGFSLGIRHALDADHVVAVSTIVSHHRSVLKAALIGLYWGIGHTLTLLIVGAAVMALKLVIPVQLALSMEFVVGVVLLVLGLEVLWGYRRGLPHTHVHAHEAQTHEHAHAHAHHGAEGEHHSIPRGKPLLLGMLHGLAGSAALMLLVLASIRSTAEGLAYILVFGVGSITGMMLISGLIGLPFALSAGRLGRLNHAIRLAAGALSILLGVLLMLSVGIGGGLFGRG